MKNARGEHLCPMTSNTAAEKEQLLHICRVQLTSGLPTYVFFKLWSADNDTADALEIWFEEEVRIMTQTCCPKHVFFFFTVLYLCSQSYGGYLLKLMVRC